MRNPGKSLFGPKILLAGFLFILLNRACAPPYIEESKAEEMVTIGQIYDDIRTNIDKPVRFSGQVMSSFFIGALGGFYFLKDPHQEKTIICLTKELPPQDGTKVSVMGVVKPFICKGNFNVLYFKTKEMEMEVPDFSDFANLP